MIRTTEDGASFEVDGPWELPAEIPETIVVECRRWLAAHDAAAGIAQEGRIKHWLLKLLGGLPGDYSEETVRMKMGAFVFALNDKPAYCFDDATLKIAMRRFKFWPSAAELIAFADEMEQWTRMQAKRAYKVVDAGPRTADQPLNRRPWAEGGSDDHRDYLRQKADEQRRRDIEILRERDAAAGKFAPEDETPKQQRGESVGDYVKRLNAHTMAQIDIGERALKRDGRMRAMQQKAAAKAAYEATKIRVEPEQTADETARNAMSGGEA